MKANMYKYWIVIITLLIVTFFVFGNGIEESAGYAIFIYLLGAYNLAPLMLKQNTSAPYGGKLIVGEHSFLRFIMFIIYSGFTLLGLLAVISLEWWEFL